MYVFSKEWIDALAEALRSDENYQKKAEGFDSLYQFIATACPKKGVPESMACGLLLPQATETWKGIREDVDYTMTAPYEVYYKIITGKLNAILALTTRKARVQGNFAKMMKYTAATNKFVEIMKELSAQFEGDFS